MLRRIRSGALLRAMTAASVALGITALAAAAADAAPTKFFLNSYNPTDAAQAFCAASLMEPTSPPGCGNTVTAPIVLESGRTYVVLVNGAVSSWGAWPADHCGTAEPSSEFPSPGIANEPAGDDAQFRFAIPLNPASCPALPKKSAFFQVDLGGGWFHPVAISNPTKPSKVYKKLKLQHPYLFKFVGEGVAPQFRFVDYHASDNSGQFKITVFG